MPTPSPKPENEYPMRLNRYLAREGFATRRGADTLIEKGLVTINGQVATLGQKVLSPEDHVEISPLSPRRNYRYYAYSKPRGVITHSPQKGERSIVDLVRIPKIFPLGRLDKDSEGLILLTDDARLTERLLHPRFEHEKEYIVTVRETIDPSLLRTLETGIIDQGDRLFAKSVRLSDKHTATLVLTEGKKHAIRRMMAHIHLTVTSLRRIRIMHIHIGKLRSGEYRELSSSEQSTLLSSLGLGPGNKKAPTRRT